MLLVLGHRQLACSERARLQWLLQAHQDWCGQVEVAPSFFTEIDSYHTRLLVPIHQGRSPGQVGKMSQDIEMREDT